MKRIGIYGYGNIGSTIGRALEGGFAGCRLHSICSADVSDAKRRIAELKHEVPLVDLEQLVAQSDLIIDCATTDAFRAIAQACLNHSRDLVTVNGAAIVAWPELPSLLAKAGSQIILVSGAVPGIDAVRAANIGQITSAKLITRKPPHALAGARFVQEKQIQLEQLSQPKLIFSGSAREGAEAFPANVNVAAALALAGIGPDKTELEVWADPALQRNNHQVVVTSDSATMSLNIENIPSPDNPKTSQIASLSILDYLTRLDNPLKIGG